MYVSVKPVEFTDEELEYLYYILNSEINELTEILKDDNPYTPLSDNSVCEAVNDLKAMMLKISDSGIFNS